MLNSSYFGYVVVFQSLLHRKGMSRACNQPKVVSPGKNIYPLDPVKRKLLGRSRLNAAQKLSRSSALTIPSSL